MSVEKIYSGKPEYFVQIPLLNFHLNGLSLPKYKEFY